MCPLFLWLACADPTPATLPPAGVSARSELAQALKSRDPSPVERAVEAAITWEGKDPTLDRLLGDALANVLMHTEAGMKLLDARPALGDPSWERAMLLASARTGDTQTMEATWKRLNRDAPRFSNPVTNSMVQRLKRDPHMSIDDFEAAIHDCTILDAQPAVGRKALEFPVSTDLLKVAPWVGADAVVMGRPRTKVDNDPDRAIGPIQCTNKLVLDEWPAVVSTTLTVSFVSGTKRVFIDIKQTGDEQWAYATSDAVAGGHWIQAMNMASAPNAEARIRERFADGLWAQPKEPSP